MEMYYGKYPAIVLDNAPQEGSHLGRVKVRVPGILEEDAGGEPQPLETIARPCFPPRFFFVPENGDHVWVEFAAGDINTPIWVGVWYPEDAPPHTSNDENPTEKQKVIRTHGGHVITMDDDDETIVIKDKHGNTVTLARGSVTLDQKDGGKMEIDNGNVTITADVSGSIKLGGGESPHYGLLQKLTAVELYLSTHQHTNGNMGSPTGPPQPPVLTESWFTTTTKAR